MSSLGAEILHACDLASHLDINRVSLRSVVHKECRGGRGLTLAVEGGKGNRKRVSQWPFEGEGLGRGWLQSEQYGRCFALGVTELGIENSNVILVRWGRAFVVSVAFNCVPTLIKILQKLGLRLFAMLLAMIDDVLSSLESNRS